MAAAPSERARYGSLALVRAAMALLFLAASSAQAIYVDFADYQGAAAGNSALIDVEGHLISISANPTRYDLSIMNAGLGVACTDRRGRCRGNQSAQIDAEWRESIVITFNDGPVEFVGVDLSRLYSGEIAVAAQKTRSSAMPTMSRDSSFRDRP